MVRIARFALPLLILASVACTRSFQVYDATQLNGKDKNRDYLFYALPRTVVKVDVPVTKIETAEEAECGGDEFKDLRAELLLDAPKKSTKFKLGPPIVATRPEADPTKVYAVDLRFRPLAVTSGVFEMTETGALTNATISQEDQSLDVVLTVAKALLSSTGAAAAAAAASTPNPAAKLKGCAAVKKQIEDTRAARLAILSDAARRETTKELVETILGKLDEIEAGLSALFTGETTKTIATARCELRPTAFDKASGTRLFIFEADAGVRQWHKDCLVPASVRSAAPGTKSVDVTATVASDGADQLATTVAGAQRPIDSEARGFFYRIPGTSVVTVDYAGDVRGRELLPIAQLGTVATLPVVGGAFVRKASVAPTLNTAGGLQKLTINGEPGGSALATGAAEIYTSRRTAAAAASAAAATAAATAAAADALAKDELTILEKQRKLVEERLKIADAEKKLADLLTKEDEP